MPSRETYSQSSEESSQASSSARNARSGRQIRYRNFGFRRNRRWAGRFRQGRQRYHQGSNYGNYYSQGRQRRPRGRGRGRGEGKNKNKPKSSPSFDPMKSFRDFGSLGSAGPKMRGAKRRLPTVPHFTTSFQNDYGRTLPKSSPTSDKENVDPQTVSAGVQKTKSQISKTTAQLKSLTLGKSFKSNEENIDPNAAKNPKKSTNSRASSKLFQSSASFWPGNAAKPPQSR